MDGYNFLDTHIKIRKLFKNILRIDKNPINEYEILLLVFQNENISVKDISKKMDISRPNITPILNTLEEKQYILKSQNDDDKRIVCVKTTSDGEKYLSEKIQTIEEQMDFYKERFNKEDVDLIFKELNQLKNNLNMIE